MTTLEQIKQDLADLNEQQLQQVADRTTQTFSKTQTTA
jgi:hypothetical protein